MPTPWRCATSGRAAHRSTCRTRRRWKAAARYREQITALGLHYSLLTQYTSFIAVDDVVRTTEAAAPVNQPLPLPQGVSNAGRRCRGADHARAGSLAVALIVAGLIVAAMSDAHAGKGRTIVSELCVDRPPWPPDPGRAARVIACRPTYRRAAGWLVLAAALWPHGRWIVRRVADGSDESARPGRSGRAGAAAGAWRGAATGRAAPRLAGAPRRRGASRRTPRLFVPPPLVCGLVAALALAAGLMAWQPASASRRAAVGLLLLALPLIASLQYYAGFPLRVLTAQASAWLLQAAGFAAERSGAAMLVKGGSSSSTHPARGCRWRGWRLLRLHRGGAVGPARRGVPEAAGLRRRARARRQHRAQHGAGGARVAAAGAGSGCSTRRSARWRWPWPAAR